MQNDAYTELAGRIEGVARTLAITLAMLEETGHLNGPALTASMRRFEPSEDAALLVAQRTLRELAGQMDLARDWRRRLDEGTHGVVLAFRPRGVQ